MNNPFEVQESPNKKNVMYSVTYIQQSHRIDNTFQWIVDEIIQMGSSAERVIIVKPSNNVVLFIQNSGLVLASIFIMDNQLKVLC